MSRLRLRRGEAVFAAFFLLVMGAALAAGAAGYFALEQRSISGAEELTTFSGFTVDGCIDGSFQSGFELAMKDQFALHDLAIELTTGIKAGIKRVVNAGQNLIRGMAVSDGLMPVGQVYSINGTSWLTNMPYVYDENDAAGYARKAGEINALAAENPGVKFYVYYCTRAEDLNAFDKTEGIASYSYPDLLRSLLDSDIAFKARTVSDVDMFRQLTYKTDHHWNNAGAHAGYLELLEMLGADFDLGAPRNIVSTLDFDGLVWRGSRWRESGVALSAEITDTFKVYKYDLPEHRVFYGEWEQGLGLAEDYELGYVVRDLSFDQYINYYGFESEKITLIYGDKGASDKNLLILGDSFVRAVREQLASHFDTTVFVNFRILNDVDIDALITEYNVDAVLLMGQQDAWSGYFLRGEESD